MVREGVFELIKTEKCYVIFKDIKKSNEEKKSREAVFYGTHLKKAIVRLAELSGNNRSMDKYLDHIDKILKKYEGVEL